MFSEHFLRDTGNNIKTLKISERGSLLHNYAILQQAGAFYVENN